MSQLSILEKFGIVQEQLNQVILGKAELVENLVIGLLAGGHVLLEGLPGLGKTQLVRALSLLGGLEDSRIQFTPDLMPMDITGAYILEESNTNGGQRDFKFRKGPIFGNLILADEINRASPKTQSALLEAMQEGRTTVLGETHCLPKPFFVIATQNPIELAGTYPLPEAQMDRFMFKLIVEDVALDVLETIVFEKGRGDLPDLEPVLERSDFLKALEAVERVEISKPIAGYISRIVGGTRADFGGPLTKYIKHPAGPRAALSIAMAARGRAFLKGRKTVGFEDVKSVATATLRHRIILDYAAKVDRVTVEEIIERLLSDVPELQREAPGIVSGAIK